MACVTGPVGFFPPSKLKFKAVLKAVPGGL